MSSHPGKPDIVVIGGGPAGCAAALMAASLDMRCVLVEEDQIGGRLHVIGALANVPGAWTDGPSLAKAMLRDIKRIQDSGHCTVVTDRALEVSANGVGAEVRLADGSVISGASVVVATGVASIAPSDADWITVPASMEIAPLWRARPSDLKGRTCVLGGDRPLGTWLRAHPEARQEFVVVHPPSDDYKVAEVREDPRVHLRPARSVAIRSVHGGGHIVEVEAPDGARSAYACDTLLTNIGNRPAAVEGLVVDADGYCPAEKQSPRILIAGDLRSARFQRIITAQGSGAQAALSCYYGALTPAVA